MKISDAFDHNYQYELQSTLQFIHVSVEFYLNPKQVLRDMALKEGPLCCMALEEAG